MNAREEKDDKWTSLIYAARYGHKNVAKLLIANGADVNLRDGGKDKYTPLYYA